MLAGLSPESWDALVRTNLDGVYHCVSAALPALRAAKGIVVIVGSVSGSWPDISGPGYQATKAGVLGFARGAALEEFDADTGVRFSVVAPGVVDTPILENRPNVPPPEQRPLMLQADDVAELCAFLAALPPRRARARADRAADAAAGARPDELERGSPSRRCGAARPWRRARPARRRARSRA